MTQEWKESFKKKFHPIYSGDMSGGYDAMPYLVDFIESLLAEQRLAVLEEVERQVEKKQEEYQLMKRQTPFQDTLFNHAVNVLKDISTLINQLKVR